MTLQELSKASGYHYNNLLRWVDPPGVAKFAIAYRLQKLTGISWRLWQAGVVDREAFHVATWPDAWKNKMTVRELLASAPFGEFAERFFLQEYNAAVKRGEEAE